MRIAFVSWDDTLPEIGGYSSISLVSYQLALQLTRFGNEVIIYGKKNEDRPAFEIDANNIIHIRLSSKQDDFTRKPYRLFERLGLINNLKRPLFASNLYSPRYIKQVAIDLRKRCPDIVHIHNFSQYAPIIRSFNPHAKVVLHMHCEWLNQLDRNSIKKRLRHVDMVVGCSNYISGKVSQRFPEFSNCCQTSYNGVDVSKFAVNYTRANKQGGKKNILYVGRLSPEKGVHVLLDSFSKVLKSFPDTHLQIVGGTGVVPYEFLVGISDDERVQDLARFYQGADSKQADYYKQLLSRLPATQMQQVSFLDYVPHMFIQDVYRNADIFVNSSLSEALGMPILEAMASEVPVIGPDVGGVPELIKHRETGLLFRPGDSESLAEAIIHLLKDDNLGRSLKMNALQEVKEHYSWENIAEELIPKYQSLLDV